MSRLKTISGKQCIKILCNYFHFEVLRQKGSHILLIRKINNMKTGVVVPNHKELKIGTLKAIIKS